MKTIILTFIWSCLIPLMALPAAYALVEKEPTIEEEQGFEFLGAAEWMQKGLELNGQGQYEEAAEAFQKVISVNPDDAVAWFSLGTAKAFSGSYEEAAGFLSQALTFDPDLMVAYSNLGAVYGRLGSLRKHSMPIPRCFVSNLMIQTPVTTGASFLRVWETGTLPQGV